MPPWSRKKEEAEEEEENDGRNEEQLESTDRIRDPPWKLKRYLGSNLSSIIFSPNSDPYPEDTTPLLKREEEEKNDCDCVHCSNQFERVGYTHCDCRVKYISLTYRALLDRSRFKGLEECAGPGHVRNVSEGWPIDFDWQPIDLEHWQHADALEPVPAPNWPSGPRILVKDQRWYESPKASKIRGVEPNTVQLPFVYHSTVDGVDRHYYIVAVRYHDYDGAPTCEHCFDISPSGVRFRYGDCRKPLSKLQNLERLRYLKPQLFDNRGRLIYNIEELASTNWFH